MPFSAMALSTAVSVASREMRAAMRSRSRRRPTRNAAVAATKVAGAATANPRAGP